MRLLTLMIDEPLPGRVLPEMASATDPEEASRRYRAIVVTTLRQLRGLADARLRLLVEPDDAVEAIRFWLLPRLAECWQAEGEIYRSAGWEIDFGGESHGFHIRAAGEILCPHLGARWVHAALVGLGRSVGTVVGPAIGGGGYFQAEAGTHDLPARVLPELPVIRRDDDWRLALDGPLGPALKRAWEEEG